MGSLKKRNNDYIGKRQVCWWVVSSEGSMGSGMYRY